MSPSLSRPASYSIRRSCRKAPSSGLTGTPSWLVWEFLLCCRCYPFRINGAGAAPPLRQHARPPLRPIHGPRNQSNHQANEVWHIYNHVLLHEKSHATGRHTIDFLLAEILIVLQCFNPFAWLYRKEVENTLEFLTHHALLRTREAERAASQLSL